MIRVVCEICGTEFDLGLPTETLAFEVRYHAGVEHGGASKLMVVIESEIPRPVDVRADS